MPAGPDGRGRARCRRAAALAAGRLRWSSAAPGPGRRPAAGIPPGEPEPGGLARTRRVVDAWSGAGGGQRDDLVSDIDRPGGLPALVGDDINVLLLARQGDHRADEVGPVRAVEPGRPHHVAGVGQQPEHGLLAGQLGAPVGGARGGAVIFRVGPPAVAAEHVVSGHVHQGGAAGGAGGGDVLRATARLPAARLVLVGLGIVYRRPGRAIDDDGRPVASQRAWRPRPRQSRQDRRGPGRSRPRPAAQHGDEVTAEHPRRRSPATGSCGSSGSAPEASWTRRSSTRPSGHRRPRRAA